MKLFELQSKHSEIYHSSDKSFTAFKNRPTWFSLNKKDALNWHKSGLASQGKQITYACSFNGKIASEAECESIAKNVWPKDEFIYSMLDVNVGEFEADDINHLIQLLEKAGFEGTLIKDYDPEDFNIGSSQSLCVFKPEKTVKIKEVLKQDGIKDTSAKQNAFEVGETVNVNPDGSSQLRGEVTAVDEKTVTVSFKGWNDDTESYSEQVKKFNIDSGKVWKRK